MDVLVEHVEIVTVNQRTCFFTNVFSTKGHVTSQPQPPTLRIGFFQCHYQKNRIVTHTNWTYKPQVSLSLQSIILTTKRMTNHHHRHLSSFQNLLFVLCLVAPPSSFLPLVRGECDFCFQGSEVEDLETATPIMVSNKIMNCVDLKDRFEANGGPESSGLTCIEWQLEGYQSV